ncbi:MAG: tetratricopeptide repeat protein [Candidatus Omnitrophota bacterium]
MKKLAKIIAPFFCIFLLFGCVDDQYALEREYWKIKKEVQNIFKNPHSSPPFELNRVVQLLDNFIAKYPDNNLSIDAKFSIARLYLVKKHYDKGRERLKEIADSYSDSDAISTEALFLLGSSYELEDNWSSALRIYRDIMKRYPLTTRGFAIPFYIAQYYKINHQPERMISAYREAIEHYDRLAQKHENSLAGLSAYNMTARCYYALEEWDKAIESLNIIKTKYKDQENLDSILFQVAMIYRNNLGDSERSRVVLEELIEKYPKSKLTKTAADLLKETD